MCLGHLRLEVCLCHDGVAPEGAAWVVTVRAAFGVPDRSKRHTHRETDADAALPGVANRGQRVKAVFLLVVLVQKVQICRAVVECRRASARSCVAYDVGNDSRIARGLRAQYPQQAFARQ